MRGGQGAQFHLPIIEGVDIVEAMADFAGADAEGCTYATTLSGEPLYEQDFTKPTAFVIGNEGAGLSLDAINAATQQVRIPMNNKLESLNAAVAAAVCLFERQRQAAKA